MTVSMYKISVPIFVQFLTALSVVLDKAAAHCEAKKIDPSALLDTRLFPDMFPLVRQVRAATDHAVNATARLAGAEPLALANTEASFAELGARLAKAIDFVKGFRPEEIDGSEDKPIKITFPSGATRDLPGSRCCWKIRCRIFISTAPRPTTFCAIAASKSASAISWERRSSYSAGAAGARGRHSEVENIRPAELEVVPEPPAIATRRSTTDTADRGHRVQRGADHVVLDLDRPGQQRLRCGAGSAAGVALAGWSFCAIKSGACGGRTGAVATLVRAGPAWRQPPSRPDAAPEWGLRPALAAPPRPSGRRRPRHLRRHGGSSRPPSGS